MGSVMFCGHVRNSKLPTLSPNLAPPKPPTVPSKQQGTLNGPVEDEKDPEEQACLSLAAGTFSCSFHIICEILESMYFVHANLF